MKSIRPLAALLVCLALVLSACTSSDSSSNNDAPAAPDGTLSTAEGSSTTSIFGEAQDFVLPTLAGDSLRLSDLRGQVVLLNFWATWCGPCIYEIPELIALQDELGPHGLTVIGVALDPEGAEVVQPFAERLGITYPIPIDTESSVAEAYGGVFALPTTYVIDQEGQITERVIGIYPVADKHAEFRQMLGLPPINNTSN